MNCFRADGARWEAMGGNGVLFRVGYLNNFVANFTCFRLVAEEMTQKIGMVRMNNFFTHRARRKAMDGSSVLFRIRDKDIFVAYGTFFYFIFMAHNMPVKNGKVGIDVFVTRWTQRKTMNNSSVITCMPRRNH